MDSAQMWAIIIGFFIPPVLAIVQQPRWPNWGRAVATFVVAIIAGLGTLWFAGTLDFSGADAKPLATNILLVLVTAIGVYHGLWKPTGVTGAIERSTSGGNAPTGIHTYSPSSGPTTSAPWTGDGPQPQGPTAPPVPSVPGSVVTVHVDGVPVITIPASDPTPATTTTPPPAA